MIQAAKMYYAECSLCENELERSDWLRPVFETEEDCKDALRDYEWLIGDGEEGEAGKIYCPHCWKTNDDDAVEVGKNINLS